MISVFDLAQLQDVLKDFYCITRIRIAVFDEQFRELISYPENRPDFCRMIRSCEAGRRRCAQCDQNACRIASKQKSAYVYRCHAGLTEAIMPLHVGGVLAGYLIFGHIFSYGSFDAGWEVIRLFCRAYPVDMDRLKAACMGMPRISADYIKSAARILHATASYLALERMAVLKEDSDAARLNAYLNEHFTQPLDSQKLCQALNLGRTHLYKLSRQTYGVGPAEHIRDLRIAKARRLLEEQEDLRIAEVGLACGYTDYNYFISVFTKETGVSPKKYRAQAAAAAQPPPK